MAEQAKVTSTDALESFRANLIIFLTKAHRSVDDVRDEVRRTRLWLQHDQRTHWEGQVRQRTRVLQQAQQELLSAKLSGLRDSTIMQEKAVLKAKRALAEAEDKLRKVKLWSRDFESRSEPLTKRLETLRHLLEHEMPKAVTYLVNIQRTLDDYAETFAVASAPTPQVEPALPEPPTS